MDCFTQQSSAVIMVVQTFKYEAPGGLLAAISYNCFGQSKRHFNKTQFQFLFKQNAGLELMWID